MRLGSLFSCFPGRRILAVVLVLTVLLTALGGWYFWPFGKTVEPPTIDRAGLDPEVARVLDAATEKVRQMPRSVAAWGKLGQVLVAHSYYDEAMICFARAEELDPKEAKWPYLQGLTLQFSDHESSVAQFRRAVQLRGDSPAMRLRLAEALLNLARIDEAEEQLQKLLAMEPKNPRGHLGLGRVAFSRRDLQTSRDCLQRAVASPLTQKAVHTLLAEIGQRSQDPVAAARERYLASELPDDQDWFDPMVDEVERIRAGRQARLDRALKQFRSQGLAEGLRQLHELQIDYPDWDQVWLNQGRILLEQREYTAAEDALSRAVKLAPQSVEGNFYLGLALFQKGDYPKAGAAFQTATRIKPDYALAHYNLGHCWKRQGNPSAALDAFREAIRCKPGYAAAHTNLGEMLACQGDKVQALEHLRLAIELNPDDTAAKKLLIQLEQGK